MELIAVSWPRLRSWSLASSDDTCVSTVLTDRNNLAAMSGVRQALAQQAQHLGLPGGHAAAGKFRGYGGRRLPATRHRPAGVAQQPAGALPVGGRSGVLVEVDRFSQPPDPGFAAEDLALR